MRLLSQQNIKGFAKRFRLLNRNKKGQYRSVPLTIKQARDVLDLFITLNGRADIKPNFIETRIRLLDICFEEKEAAIRWDRAKEFLLQRLESQILGEFITQPTLQHDEVEAPDLLTNLLDPNSYLSQCVNTLALFNITDEKANIPDNVVIDFGSGIKYSFPTYRLKKNAILLVATIKGGGIIEKEIPASTENFSNIFGNLSDSKFSSACSILRDQDSNIHIIKQHKFFDFIKKLHPDMVKAYRLNDNIKPSELLKIFNQKNQQRIMTNYTGNPIKEWKWTMENHLVIDIFKVIKEYFSDVNNEISSIRPIYPIPWKAENRLFDKDTLRYELTDSFLSRFPQQERQKLLIEKSENLSIFNLKTFRETVERWEQDKENGKIKLLLQKLLSHYSNKMLDSKQRDKVIQYIKIKTYIQQGIKTMEAYKLASPREKVNTVAQRYLRLKDDFKKAGYNIDDHSHLAIIKRDWEVSDAELVF